MATASIFVSLSLALRTTPSPAVRCAPARMMCAPSSAGDENLVACAAASAVLHACAGLDRGVVATPEDVRRMESAIAVFEDVAQPPFTDVANLATRLEGTWRLLYSSSLAGHTSNVPSKDVLAQYAGTLVDTPTARSRLAIGDVSQRILPTARVEESVALRLRVPWPLPPAPELRLTFTGTLEAAAAAETEAAKSASHLVTTLDTVRVRVAGAPTEASLPVGQLRDALARVLPASLSALPLAAEAQRVDAGARRLHITALGGGLRVSRSALGELRIFARETGGGPLLAAAAGNGTVTDDGGAPNASAVLSAMLAEVEAKATRAAAADAAAAVRQIEERAAAAVSAAAAKLAEERELAEARAAAAKAVAAAELAEAVSMADDALATALLDATAEREQLVAEHIAALQAAEDQAATELGAARRELELFQAQAAEEEAAAKAAYLAEKQSLGQKVADANERAQKAKAAAQAVIGNL